MCACSRLLCGCKHNYIKPIILFADGASKSKVLQTLIAQAAFIGSSSRDGVSVGTPLAC